MNIVAVRDKITQVVRKSDSVFIYSATVIV